jgi:hypothetical protein
MKPCVAEQVEALTSMTVSELRERYAEVFGEPTRSHHKDQLRKRIAWRLQANEEGGLSERALRRAEELANESDLRMLAPKGGGTGLALGRTVIGKLSPKHDQRLPMPGAVLKREYHGRTLSVTVLTEGFEYEGTVYRSLTAVAKAITGTHWNGFHFFFGPASKAGRP